MASFVKVHYTKYEAIFINIYKSQGFNNVQIKLHHVHHLYDNGHLFAVIHQTSRDISDACLNNLRLSFAKMVIYNFIYASIFVQ